MADLDEGRIGNSITKMDTENTSPLKFKSHITVECPRMNESHFIGTLNYSEAKEKIFSVGLGLTPDLLRSVKMTFNKHPVIYFNLIKEIDISKLPNSRLTIERKYHRN